jgi:hypothetical protein
MSRVACLLVTCCLEQSRADILANVVSNLQEQAPELHETLTVFDNASTVPGVIDVLRDCYTHVYQADKNVGYWSAISWWLDLLADDPPSYTYVIESDMVHYSFQDVYRAASFLDEHPELGAVRLHEYSVEHMHLFNKDRPVPGSRSNLWQSHTNRVTGEGVRHTLVEAPFWKTNFLTQLPALNRYPTMKQAFADLSARDRPFTEVEFQRLYHAAYPEIAVLDGGIFHCDLNHHGTKSLTGSWTPEAELKRLGYQPTRRALIAPKDQYVVARV